MEVIQNKKGSRRLSRRKEKKILQEKLIFLEMNTLQCKQSITSCPDQFHGTRCYVMHIQTVQKRRSTLEQQFTWYTDNVSEEKKSGGRPVVKSDFFLNCSYCTMRMHHPNELVIIDIIRHVNLMVLKERDVGQSQSKREFDEKKWTICDLEKKKIDLEKTCTLLYY